MCWNSVPATISVPRPSAATRSVKRWAGEAQAAATSEITSASGSAPRLLSCVSPGSRYAFTADSRSTASRFHAEALRIIRGLEAPPSLEAVSRDLQLEARGLDEGGVHSPGAPDIAHGDGAPEGVAEGGRCH